MGCATRKKGARKPVLHALRSSRKTTPNPTNALTQKMKMAGCLEPGDEIDWSAPCGASSCSTEQTDGTKSASTRDRIAVVDRDISRHKRRSTIQNSYGCTAAWTLASSVALRRPDSAVGSGKLDGAKDAFSDSLLTSRSRNRVGADFTRAQLPCGHRCLL
jgi:hypothetical protein